MALTRNRLLLAKAESSYGTSPSPAGADAVLISALDVQPLQLELKDRELIRGYLGQSAQIVGQTSVGVTFSVELAASGTAGTAPRWGPLIKACGFSETIVASTSVTYAPVSSSFSSVALDFRNDGQRHLILGTRGNVAIEMSAGELPKLNFNFTGIYAAPTATANPSATFTNQADPVAVNADNTTSVSVHSYSACMNAFSLDMANNVIYRQLAGCTKQVMITNRVPTGSITIELPDLGTKDYFSIAAAQTAGSISFQHGQTAGNRATVTMSNCAFDSPSYEDGDGVQHITLPFRPLPSSSGNDEISIALT
jgi:hypothetical protein